MAWLRLAVRVVAAATGLTLIAEIYTVAAGGNLADRIYVGVAACIAVTTASLALLISQRRPTNMVAALLSWMALLTTVVSFSDTYGGAHLRQPDRVPAMPDLAIGLLNVTWVWLYAAVALLMLYFPDGVLLGPRWRWVAGGLPCVGLAILLVMDTTPGPYDSPFATARHPLGDLPAGLSIGLKVILFPTLVALVVASVVSLRIRFKRGDDVLRAQVKWLVLAGLALPGTVLLSWIGFLVFGDHNLAGVGFAILYAGVPVATTIAILRHNLYDVDRALSAAVTYSAVTAVLLGVFALASFLVGLVFNGHSVGGAAGVTAAAALAFAPVRLRLQRRVDRRLYPIRRAALQATEDLRTSITVGRAGPEELEEALRIAMRDPELRVGILVPGGSGFVDANGAAVDIGDSAVPVSAHGHQIGAIVTKGSAPVQLLREVADASAMLVEMGRLRLALSSALRDVASSRSRLLRIGYEERRRLERDLHDGAQQRLVSLGMALRLAQRHLNDNTVDVDGLLDESVAQLGTAVAELREVAHGLRPSCLDDGLQPALSALAATAALPIDLEIAADGAIPDDIATTAYYVVSEAVANAAKHAEASRIGLCILQGEGQLQVRIEDNGCGGAVVRPGSGLAGLTDRVSAAGGSLAVRSLRGQGTVVEAMLPCAS